MFVSQFSPYDPATFERLYDTYASRLLGFITKYTDTKKQAEQYLEKVFLQAYNDINSFDCNAEKKLLYIALIVCKPAIELKRKKNSEFYLTAV